MASGTTTLDQPWLALVDPADRERAAGWWRELVAGRGPNSADVRLDGGSGDHRWCLVRASPRRDQGGAVTGWVGVCTDIHEHKLAEDSLRRYRDELEAALAARALDLRDLDRRARSAERIASLGSVAVGFGHDMANVLLNIRARVEALASLDLPMEAREDLADVETATDQLQRISAGMRLLSAEPEAEPGFTADLDAWWRQADEVLRSGVPRYVRLEWALAPGTPGVSLGPQRLTQAVFSLLQSAGQSCQGRNGAAIRIAAERSGAGRVRLTIGRAGATPPSQDTRSGDAPLAPGFGLSLVRGLMEAVGGTLSINSESGQTPIFVMVLPQAPLIAGTSAPPRVVVSESAGQTAAVAVMVLRGLGARVDRRGDPAAADLWVAGPDDAAQIEDRLGCNPRLRAVVLAGRTAAGDERGMNEVDNADHRVMYLGAHPPAGVLRDALARALGEIRGHPGTASTRQE